MSDDSTIQRNADRDEWIDKICDEFERAWKGGKRPAIDAYLTRVEEESRAELLRQLLAVELEMRRTAGEKLDIDEYRTRFPEYPTAVKGAFALDQAARLAPAGRLPKLDRYETRAKLGQGTYGVVYLAYDPQLQRQVALKVPLLEQIASSQELAHHLKEARNAVAVETSGIVRILDIRLDHEPPFIVMDYIDGGSLKDLLADGPLPPQRAVELLMEVAEALDHAHRKRIFHLDLKPANILLDRQGKAFLTDFGFAIRQDDRGRYIGHPTGSPAYMSPEQARREANKFDGTSDIWSLGVILYEMLSGQRPFVSSKELDLREAITHASPQRLRQLDPNIPAALERICLKCLARHQDERYATAADLRRDLRWWQEQQHEPADSSAEPSATPAVAAGPAVPIRPQGLRSFTADHADFFLSLLPGPRDRRGLPESLLFWKHRIESWDLNETFSVGVVFGPSGCGKSSFVSAGLVPHLSAAVITIRVTCTSDQTELDLLGRLRCRFPSLSPDAALPEMMAAIRDDRTQEFCGQHQKVLLVLDQFEQWLHAWQSDPEAQLVSALRHCDGRRVQCLLVVRADFFHTLSDFMRQIGVRLREGQNLAGVDLFDKQHALQILEAFGHGYGRLDAPPSEMQRAFLRQVVDEVATDGKVICVRLSLIGEMMKHRDWTPASWSSVGRSEGVREAFLEETFDGPSAPPSHREHSAAARNVLEALLPEAGVQIKGEERSFAELLCASRYEEQPEAFRELLEILDDEVRLITPVEPRWSAPAAGTADTDAGPPLESRRYQLTHDYLVPSLRSWLTRKRRQTAQGRAELLLAERAAWWSRHRDARLLPTLAEWAGIHRWTQRTRWNELERQMMRRADQRMLQRIMLAVAALASILGFGWWAVTDYRHRAAQALVAKLPDARASQIPEVIRELHRSSDLAPYVVRDLDNRLQAPVLRDWERAVYQIARLHVAPDPALLPAIVQYLAEAPDEQVLAIRDALPVDLHRPTAQLLWGIASAPEEDRHRRMATALALAALDPHDAQWQPLAPVVAGWLADTAPLALDRLLAGFEPAGAWLAEPLANLVEGDDARLGEASAQALARFGSQQPELLVRAALHAEEKELAALLPALGQHPASVSQRCRTVLRQASAAPWPDDPPREERDRDIVNTDLVNRMAGAGGIVTGSFAACPLLRWDAFESLAAELDRAGYRPSRVRPAVIDGEWQVSAVWRRGTGRWTLQRSLTGRELVERDADLRTQGFEPADLATHENLADAAGPRTRYACLWTQTQDPQTRARLSLDLDLDQVVSEQSAATREDYYADAVGVLELDQGAAERFGVLWKKTAQAHVPEHGNRLEFGTRYARLEAIPWDLAVRAPATGTSAGGGEEKLHVLEPGAWDVATWKDNPEPLSFVRASPHSGQWSVQLSAAVPNDIMLQQRVRVDPAGTYLVAGWVRTRDVEIQQEGGALGANLSVFSLGQSSASVAGSSDWTYVTHVFSAGGLSEVVICARLGGTFSACTGTAWFDDLHVVALEETDLATHAWKETTFLTPARRSGNLLRNGDFETPPIAVAWRWLPHWESRLMEAVPVADFPVRAAELAGAGFRPTTIATNRATTRDQLRIHASWARYLGDPQWQNTDAKRRANAAVILAMFSQFDDSLNLLRDDAYPSARSYLIERLYLAQPGLDRMVDLLRTQAEPSVRYGLLLSMQRMIENDESQTPLTSGVRDVVESLQHDADPGVSSAAAWLCRSSWSSTGEAATVPEGRADGEPDRSRGLPFLQGPAGHRLVRFPAAAREFLMGTVGEPPNRRTETLHVRRINHGFAIAAQEVTVQQYSQFVEDLAGRGIVLRHDISYSPTPDCPQNSVTWYEAAMYCRWLGEQEGLPEDQQCYPRITEIGPDMVLPRDCLRRTGYRLPTEAEWEFACRGGACSTRFFGEATSQLAGYACYAGNSQARTMAVGQLMPNRYGLFDMLGNVWEWCHGAFLEYPVRFRCQTGADDSYTAALFPADGASRQMPPLVYRGGSFTDFVDEVRTAQRVGDSPNERNFTLGFRIARTLID